MRTRAHVSRGFASPPTLINIVQPLLHRLVQLVIKYQANPDHNTINKGQSKCQRAKNNRTERLEEPVWKNVTVAVVLNERNK